MPDKENKTVDIRLRGDDAERFENARLKLEKSLGLPVDKSKFVIYLIKAQSE